eukprot:6797410-Prymnesium_polylepis.1
MASTTCRARHWAMALLPAAATRDSVRKRRAQSGPLQRRDHAPRCSYPLRLSSTESALIAGGARLGASGAGGPLWEAAGRDVRVWSAAHGTCSAIDPIVIADRCTQYFEYLLLSRRVLALVRFAGFRFEGSTEHHSSACGGASGVGPAQRVKESRYLCVPYVSSE